MKQICAQSERARDRGMFAEFCAHATAEAQAAVAAFVAHVGAGAPAPAVPAQVEFFAVLLHALPAELSFAQEARLAAVYDTVAASLRAAHGSLSWMAAGQAQAKSAAVWRVCRAWLAGRPPAEFAEFVAETLNMLAPAHYDLVAAVAPDCAEVVGRRAGAWAAVYPDAFAAACQRGLGARLPASAWPWYFVAAGGAALNFDDWTAAVRVYNIAHGSDSSGCGSSDSGSSNSGSSNSGGSNSDGSNSDGSNSSSSNSDGSDSSSSNSCSSNSCSGSGDTDPETICARVARKVLVDALASARCYAVARALRRCCGALTAAEQERVAAGSAPARRVGLKTRR